MEFYHMHLTKNPGLAESVIFSQIVWKLLGFQLEMVAKHVK